MTCCRSCTGYQDLGLPEGAVGVAVAWTFGGQGSELVWRDGDPYFRGEPDETCWCTEDEYEYDEESGEEVLSWEGEECRTCRYGPDDPAERPADRVFFYHENGGGEAVRSASLSIGMARPRWRLKWPSPERLGCWPGETFGTGK